MLKVYYCVTCERHTYLQFEKDICCRKCNEKMIKIKIAFPEFVKMDQDTQIDFIRTQIERR